MVLLEEDKICCMLADYDGHAGDGGACCWGDWCGSWVGLSHESNCAEHVVDCCGETVIARSLS